MAPVKVDPDKVRTFKDANSFYKWLGKNNERDDEIWIKIHNVDSWKSSILRGCRRSPISRALTNLLPETKPIG